MRHRNARAPRLGAALIGITLIAGLPACSSPPNPDPTVNALLTAWSKGDFTGLALLGDDNHPLAPEAAKAELTTLAGDLTASPTLKVSGKPTVKDTLATTPVSVSWPVAPGVNWQYPTTVRARLTGRTWVAYFGPGTVHPQLKAGDALALSRTAAERGPILDGADQPLVTSRPVVVVGVQPSLVTDAAALVRQLGAAFASVGVDAGLDDLPARIKAAKPDAFVEVVTLRREAYDAIRTAINPLAGTVFHESTLSLAPTRVFARALLGTGGEGTKENLDRNPGVSQAGDLIGHGGLQERYDARLRGTPAVSVTIAGKTLGATPSAGPATPTASAAGALLFHADAQSGKPVKTTLDVKTQNAADAALTPIVQRSALVAIRISDGAVVAVANGPNGGELNLAFTAQVPPGSTFKAVTALGVLTAGSVTADTIVPCPKTLTVDGRTFKNAHDFELGNVALHTDFAQSCNTAFASLAPKLGPDGLARTAAGLGIGVPWDLGVDVFSGTCSTGGSASEQAAAAFGQGTTIVSPIALAGAAAAIARGQFKQPTLVLNPAPARAAPDGAPLNGEAVTALRTMMREVVTGGTATALNGVAGPPVSGKTGTAEYDNDPAHTHSWFMGFRGDLAFAVFVENGGVSTDAAVPIAVKFLATLG